MIDTVGQIANSSNSLPRIVAVLFGASVIDCHLKHAMTKDPEALSTKVHPTNTQKRNVIDER